MRSLIKFGTIPVLLLLASCVAKRTETYQDKNVFVQEKDPPLFPFNVHGSGRTFLKFNGKTYEGVRGSAPYYLEVPELKSILFVTEQRSGKVIFHVANLHTKETIAIDGDESGFGGHIGSAEKPGQKGSDYVEKVETNRIYLSKRSLNWKETTVLNLDTKVVERLETVYLDANGQVTNRAVQSNPASPRRWPGEATYFL